MTEDVTEKDKVPFGACFKHEIKAATKWYVKTIGLCIAVFVVAVVVAAGFVYIGFPCFVWLYAVASLSTSTFIDAIRLVVAVVSGIIGNAWESISDYHVPIMAGAAIISPPIVYALGVCTYRRLPDTWKTQLQAVTSNMVASIVAGTIVSSIICFMIDFVIVFYNAVSDNRCQFYNICSPTTDLLSWPAFLVVSVVIIGIAFVVPKDNSPEWSHVY